MFILRHEGVAVTPVAMIRMALLVVGIAFFAYALNTGLAWPRWVAIGCVAVALLLRIVDQIRRR